jgi:hypothetical protein
MKKSRKTDETTSEAKRPKKTRKLVTLDGREKQLIHLTIELAEKQIRNGTASSQVMTHFLKLGSTVEQLEKEKLQHENLLLQAKTESLKSAKKTEEMFRDAIAAFGIYSGKDPVQTSNQEEEDD